MNQEDIDRILQLVAYINQAYDSNMKSYRPMDAAIVEAHAIAPDVVKSLQWRPAAPGIEGRWGRCFMCFACPCGTEHDIDKDGETVKCDCGITYRLRHYVEADRNMVAQ